jgi:hypothetical protein
MKIGKDFWPAAALLAANLFLVFYMYTRESGAAVFGVSPRTLPMAMAGLIILLSAVLMVAAVLRAPAQGTDKNETGGGVAAARHVVLLALSSVAYIALMPWIGYFVASALFVGWTAWLFGNRRPLVIAALMILAPLALQFFFEKFMVIPLPEWRL